MSAARFKTFTQPVLRLKVVYNAAQFSSGTYLEAGGLETKNPMTSGATACPKCGHNNPATTSFCIKCNTSLTEAGSASLDDAATLTIVTGGTPPPITPGMTIGGRYEIISVLGKGGMGAVYKARDHEVDRLVALKVIQPQLANNPAMLRRFKQEMILARQITHRNVVRIFDIGEADGIKFITMEYIEGVNLKTLIQQRGKFTVEDALPIVRQICHALEAAHAEGVIHRDLKPHNIMIDSHNKAVVMDFGIAHAPDQSGGTLTGAVIGTPEYMSPEQAQGKRVDARSDIFSLGIIFYELLTGRAPFKADTALESMFKRTRDAATPPAEVDFTVPLGANDVVIKCLQIDPARRYQNIKELLFDLDTLDLGKKLGWWDRTRLRLRRTSIPWKSVAAATTLGLLLLYGSIIIDRPPKNTVAPKAIQVLVADFNTSEASLEGTVEPILGLALEGASFIQTANRIQARATASQQQNATALNESAARLVAVRQGIDLVVSGSIVARGAGYRITAKAIRSSSGDTVASAGIDADRKDTLPAAIGKLATELRSALGDVASKEVKAADAETFSAASLEALQSYARAQQLRDAGKWEEAIRYYTNAIELDPNMGRAYSGIAAAYSNMGRGAEAEKYYQLALARIDRMTDREKYRTRSAYYVFTKNTDKAIEELNALLAQYPADAAARNNLALSYFRRREFSRALVEGRSFVELYPHNDIARDNVALFAMYAGDFDTARAEAQKVLQSSPSIVKAHIVVAMSDLAQNRPDAAIQRYEALKGISMTGASLAAAGLADVALFEGRSADAVTLLTQGIAGDLTANNRSPASNKLATLATVYLVRGENAKALDVADRAVAGSKEDSVLFQAARIYITLQQAPKAQMLVDQLESRLEAEPRAYAKLLGGEMDLSAGRPRQAIDKFRQAQKLADTWLGRLALGRAYLDIGSFAEASSEFDLCIKRRGEATAVFLDDIPSYHVLPQVYYYLGRTAEGLKSAGAAEWYRTFLSIKQKADRDPLVTDARRRLGERPRLSPLSLSRFDSVVSPFRDAASRSAAGSWSGPR
jgi:serine/threonine protein kinase/tetratricopeptide (TPR) repeat protein